jgi:hypothetical protein
MKGYATLEDILATRSTISKLRSLNIKLDPEGYVSLTQVNGSLSYSALVNDKKKTNPFFFGVSDWQYCTLALAITQECQNDYIDQSDIDFVNHVFKFKKPITYADVQEFNSKYI